MAAARGCLQPAHSAAPLPLPLTTPSQTAQPHTTAARSASHLELFALSAPPPKPALPSEAQRQRTAELQAALTEAVVAKTVAAKDQEVAALVAGVAAKYGLAADYSKAEDTIKAVWAEQPVSVGGGSHAVCLGP